jgi:hypothetical protein
MKAFATVLLSIIVMMWTSPILHAECVCPGMRLARDKGGDGAPLYWGFDAYVVQSGTVNSPPLICFKRVVTNASDLKVLNIRWDSAGFRRKMIPVKDSNSSCPTLSGELTDKPVLGPLYHGVSSDHYDTTVHPPRDGWKQAAASLSDWPLIRSSFEVDINEKQFAEVIIYSSASTPDNKSFDLIYELENRGNAPIRLLLNLPVADAMEKDLPFINDFFFPPNSRKLFSSSVQRPIKIQTATAVISNAETKEGLAVDAVGVYAPIDGKRSYSDDQLYERVQ